MQANNYTEEIIREIAGVRAVRWQLQASQPDFGKEGIYQGDGSGVAPVVLNLLCSASLSESPGSFFPKYICGGHGRWQAVVKNLNAGDRYRFDP